MAVANKSQRTHVPLDDIETLARDVLEQPQITPVQLLTCVREGLAAEEMHLLFDYFGTHERGIQLLRKLKAAVHEDMVEYFGENYIEDDSQLPYVVGYIFDVVSGSDKAAEQLDLPNHGSKILSKAAEVVKAFLDHENNGMKGLRTTRALTRSVQYLYAQDRLQEVQIFDLQRWAKEQ